MLIRNALLQYLITCSQLSLPDAHILQDFYIFNDVQYCYETFSELVKVSTYLLREVHEDFNNGRKVEYEHANKKRNIMSAATEGFIAWMQVYASRFGQDAPDEVCIVLPKVLMKTELYKLYTEDSLGVCNIRS